MRRFTLGWLFMELSRLQLVGRLLRLYQRCGLQWLVRHSGVLLLLPKRLRELEAITPPIRQHFSDDLIAPITPESLMSGTNIALRHPRARAVALVIAATLSASSVGVGCFTLHKQ